MTSPSVDALRVIISTLKSCIPGVWIADVLPENRDLLDNLPAVRVDLLPGEEVVGFGGPLSPVRDEVALDIDVIAASRAAAVPVADRVRQVLHALPTMPGAGVTFVDCPYMSTRPDLNPHARRLGVDAVVHLSTLTPHTS